jgi:hypothetical protein
MEMRVYKLQLAGIFLEDAEKVLRRTLFWAVVPYEYVDEHRYGDGSA